jgi:hypothetical protein
MKGGCVGRYSSRSVIEVFRSLYRQFVICVHIEKFGDAGGNCIRVHCTMYNAGGVFLLFG